MLKNINRIFERGNYRKKDYNKAEIFQRICEDPSATRKKLARDLSIRPTTVCTSVQELLDDHLVQEGKVKNTGQSGRPELFVKPNYNRSVAVSVYTESREIRAALVNLGEQIVYEKKVAVPVEASTDDFKKVFTRLIRETLDAKPENAELLGTGISLVGTVNPSTGRWVASARWPRMKDLDFREIETELNVGIQLKRMLDTELEYLLTKNIPLLEENVVLFHWGFGIGSAYAHQGRILNSGIGRFGEVGHMKVSIAAEKTCLCGDKGCVESVAAIWALLPELKPFGVNLPQSEADFTALLKKKNIAGSSSLKNAQQGVTETLMNLHKVFYPDRTYLIGPFFNIPEICEHVKTAYLEALPDYARDAARAELIPGGFEGCLFGNVYPFFRKKLETLLTAKQ